MRRVVVFDVGPAGDLLSQDLSPGGTVAELIRRDQVAPGPTSLLAPPLEVVVDDLSQPGEPVVRTATGSLGLLLKVIEGLGVNSDEQAMFLFQEQRLASG